MGLILWIIFGAIVGWIASTIIKSDMGIIGDIVLGIVGALIGGGVVSFLGGTGITGFNFYSAIVSIVGAIIIIWIGRLIANR